MLRRIALFALISQFAPIAAPARAESVAPDPANPAVTWGGFIDTYYAFDFNQPPAFDRGYTTQPARHNEFNVNLAYIEARIRGERSRGRLALQAGTSVQASYLSEPTSGVISGPLLTRHIQEGTVGYRVSDAVWIDGGIYFSHLGFESFISRDNWTYSRSFSADFSPYIQSGVKVSWQFNPYFFAQFQVLNGWENISENTQNKALGAQLSFTPNERWTITYNNFLGRQDGPRERFYNEIILRYGVTANLQVAAIADLGIQTQPYNDGPSQSWHGTTLLARYQFTPKLAMAARLENYTDPNQVIVVTGTPDGFRTYGASLNFDVQPERNLLWRTEFRGFSSVDAVFPAAANTSAAGDGFVVTTLALSF